MDHLSGCAMFENHYKNFLDLHYKCNSKKSVTHGGKPLRMVFADNKERGECHASLQTSYHRRAGKAIPDEEFRTKHPQDRPGARPVTVHDQP